MNSCLTRLKRGDIIHYLIVEAADIFYSATINFDHYLDKEMQYVIDGNGVHGRCYYLRHMQVTKIVKKK